MLRVCVDSEASTPQTSVGLEHEVTCIVCRSPVESHGHATFVDDAHGLTADIDLHVT